MYESVRWLSIALVVGCAAEAPAPSCQGTEAECLFSAMTFHDFALEPGPALPLSAVRTDAVRALAVRDAAPDGEQSAVRVTGPGSLHFETAEGGQELTLSWDDPFGCRPAFCFTPCPKNARCFAGSSCSQAVRDGQTSGVTHHWLAFEQPPPQTLELQLLIAPVSGLGCPEDVTGLIEAASDEITVGAPELISLQVPGALPGPGQGEVPSGDVPSVGRCGGGLHASTAACTPLGTSGVLDACISRSEYESATGMSLPAAAAPDGTTGCMDTQRGVVVKPCAIGSTCRVASACGGGSTLGGVCRP